MNLIKALKRNILNTRYLFIFLFLLVLVYYSLSQELLEVMGLSEAFVRTASEASFLQNLISRQYMMVLTVAGPLLTTIACSFIYVDDWEANMVGPILMRTSRFKYQVYNFISVFISAFMLIFGPLILGYLISTIVCPVSGAMDNMTATPSFFIYSFNAGILGMWETFNPLAFTLFHIFLVAMILALMACLAYVISQTFYWNRYFAIGIVFVGYLVYNIVLSKMGLEMYTFFNLIDPYANKPTIDIIIFMIIALFIIVVGLFIINLKRGNDDD